MMSDKCAPALDVSVEEQDSIGSFGEDSVQTLLSLALADPERAKERFPAYRLTRLVTARFDMDDTEARIFADLARPLATVRLLHDTAPFNDHLRDAIERFGLTSLFCDNGPGPHHHAIRPTRYDYHADGCLGHGKVAGRLSRDDGGATDARRFDHLALSWWKGQSLPASRALHMARRRRNRRDAPA
jgi:hypothetical protein